MASCGHTHAVGPAEAKPSPAASSSEPSEPSEPPARTKARPNGDIEIASSPAATLKPGAARAIQEHLRKSGDLETEPTGTLDGPTRKALTRFQRANGLPATGLPDDATVSKLGLKAEDVFRSGRD